MPELPEVETIRRDLEPLIRGREIVDFSVAPGASRLLRGVPADAVSAQLRGRRFESIQRRGKYLGMSLDDGACCVVHLRMTGSLRFREPDAEPDRFTRATFQLADGYQLRFVDVRKFGTIDIVDEMADALPQLGPEPLSDDFDVTALWDALRGRTIAVKAALLDQRSVAGIGNIYADEALFLAHLHPEAPAGSLRPRERVALHAAVRQVLEEGVAHGGASFRDYTNVAGGEGSQQHFVRVFRRTEQPCDDCGAIIRRSVVGGRATHWCPRCQHPRQASRQVNSKLRRRKGAPTETRRL